VAVDPIDYNSNLQVGSMLRQNQSMTKRDLPHACPKDGARRRARRDTNSPPWPCRRARSRRRGANWN